MATELGSVAAATAYLVKLARFCITLATRVSFRAVFSLGYSTHGKEQLGDDVMGINPNRKCTTAMM